MVEDHLSDLGMCCTIGFSRMHILKRILLLEDRMKQFSHALKQIG
jgi:hypothetical protein